MKINRQEVGLRLQQLRTEKAMTMEQLGKKLGVSKAAISRWEKGERIPRPRFLKAYADYFNVPIDWIKYGELKEEEQMDNKMIFDEFIEQQMKEEWQKRDVLAAAIIFNALKTEELALGEVIDHESNIDASINILKMIKERLNEER